jgi:hypothetical protein
MKKDFSEEEKREIRAVWERQKEGYRLIQAMRDEDLRSVNTPEAMRILAPAFREALKLPMRKSSGLIEFYKILNRSR